MQSVFNRFYCWNSCSHQLIFIVEATGLCPFRFLRLCMCVIYVIYVNNGFHSLNENEFFSCILVVYFEFITYQITVELIIFLSVSFCLLLFISRLISTLRVLPSHSFYRAHTVLFLPLSHYALSFHSTLSALPDNTCGHFSKETFVHLHHLLIFFLTVGEHLFFFKIRMNCSKIQNKNFIASKPVTHEHAPCKNYYTEGTRMYNKLLIIIIIFNFTLNKIKKL